MTNGSNLVIGVDIGTSVTKAILADPEGIISRSAQDYPESLSYPEPGWAEQDAGALKNAIISTIKSLLTSSSSRIKEVRGISFTSQMQGVLPLDEKGTPLYPILTWLDTRAAHYAQEVMFNGWPNIKGFGLRKILKFLKITGGAPGVTGKDTISKLFWLKEDMPDLYAKTFKFVDTKDYAVFLATGKFITSVDMAYITWLMDTRNDQFQWSEEICSTYGLDAGKLCDIRPSTENLGPISPDFAEKTGLPSSVQVINGSGDLLTSAIGSGAIETGKLHVNVGTAGWVGCHFPHTCKNIKKYTGTIASGMPGVYLILSKQETLGGALDWARKIHFPHDLVGDKPLSEIYRMIDDLVKSSPPGAHKLLFTPWLFGERSPINNPFLRGQILNIDLSTTRGNLFRSIYEGIAFNLRWGMEVVEDLSKLPQKEVRLIGGASKSDEWCQIFADVWQKTVLRVSNPQQASALGAATIAMVGLGILSDFTQISRLSKIEQSFSPDPDKKGIYDELYSVYQKIYERNRPLFNTLNKS